MTGEPEYTFRDTDEMPECRNCGEEMVFVEHTETGGEFNERDRYRCEECGAELEDRWTY